MTNKNSQLQKLGQLMFFGMLLLFPHLVAAQTVTPYVEDWKVTEWRVATLSGYGGTNYPYVWDQYKYYTSSGHTTGLYYLDKRGYQVGMTPSPNGLLQTSAPLCLGPAKWQVKTQINGRTITEDWTGQGWQDSDPHLANFAPGNVYLNYGSTSLTTGDPTMDFNIQYSNKLDSSYNCGANSSQVIFNPAVIYGYTVACYGDRVCDTSLATCQADRENRSCNKTIVNNRWPIADTRNPLTLWPGGLYGGLIANATGSLPGGTSWANRYRGGFRSFPSTWKVTGRTP